VRGNSVGPPGDGEVGHAMVVRVQEGTGEHMTAPRVKEKYQKEVVPALMKRFGYKNVMRVPSMRKIVINVGMGDAIQNAKLMDAVSADLGAITGQKPVIRRASRAISNFKLKAGMPIGCMVTLRKARMYEFYDRLVNVAIPRIRDFRGTSPNSFDGRGNYNLGIGEQIIFPEIDYDKVEKIKGMNITVVTSAQSDEEGFELLKGLGMPFRR
jgi:large subunit ribosomal protein L5